MAAGRAVRRDRRHRLQLFARVTGPAVAYYQNRGILVAVDADQPPESVTAEILARLSDVPLAAASDVPPGREGPAAP